MNKNHLRGAGLSACLLLFSLGVSAAPTTPDPAQGKAAAGLCETCHKADGSGQNIPDGESWPRLAGLDADYLTKQMQDFKTGKRRNPSMEAFAQMLDDEKIVHISAWFASLPATTSGQPEDTESYSAEQLERGKQLATVGDWDQYIVPCSSCHGPDNLGVGTVFPAIAGQHFGYIRDQLLGWQQGHRDNDAQELMATIAARMSTEDVNAVAAWLSLQPAAAQ
ncbi:c-type cytochrome [Pseudomonas sp. FME51]|uniref:c-type cytochrome n=1 Tax=Pseudomonas sp. FME51 TaxID=2742609 RepID=UPI0018689216|nr:c-type cytochrome [Pseudomonas sp. FME51]